MKQDTWYVSVTQDLIFESSAAKDKEIVTVTNNGSIPAIYVEAHVLFFSGDVLVDYSSAFFSDNDYELKPGKSITEEVRCWEPYDSFLIVLTDRG